MWDLGYVSIASLCVVVILNFNILNLGFLQEIENLPLILIERISLFQTVFNLK